MTIGGRGVAGGGGVVTRTVTVAWGDKVQFLDLRAALPFLGALDYIF